MSFCSLHNILWKCVELFSICFAVTVWKIQHIIAQGAWLSGLENQWRVIQVHCAAVLCYMLLWALIQSVKSNFIISSSYFKPSRPARWRHLLWPLNTGDLCEPQHIQKTRPHTCKHNHSHSHKIPLPDLSFSPCPCFVNPCEATCSFVSPPV